MVVKTFRGLLADGGQDRIRLSSIKGKVGYKIVKFQIMPKLPGSVAAEHIVQIFKVFQTSVPTVAPTVDFSDNALLAAATVGNSVNNRLLSNMEIIFDNEIFNQDIYVTHSEDNAAEECNYYIELEVIPLTDQGAEYTTLKDIRTHS